MNAAWNNDITVNQSAMLVGPLVIQMTADVLKGLGIQYGGGRVLGVVLKGGGAVSVKVMKNSKEVLVDLSEAAAKKLRGKIDDVAKTGNQEAKKLQKAFTQSSPGNRIEVAKNKMQTVRKLGKEGENAAGIVKNTQRIDSLSRKAKYRIPDEIKEKVVTEVKNASRVDFNCQIRDSLHHAIEQGKDFILVVRRDTILSQSLKDAIRDGWIKLEYLR
jgi:hypothetical protein